MWKVLGCVLAAGIALSGQNADPVGRLNPVLQRAMTGETAADELAQAIVSLAPVGQQVMRNDVGRLAAALSGSMQGHAPSAAQTATLSRCIVDLLQGSDVSNFELAVRFRAALTGMGIVDPKTDLIVRRFVEVGGPDDPPTKPNPPVTTPYRAK